MHVQAEWLYPQDAAGKRLMTSKPLNIETYQVDTYYDMGT